MKVIKKKDEEKAEMVEEKTPKINNMRNQKEKKEKISQGMGMEWRK